jgi:hypothetical protein
MTDNTAEFSPSKLPSFAKYGLIILVPALLTGIFSIVPKIYDVLTQPKAILNYTMIAGPTVSRNGTYLQIISVDVQNAGSTPLTDVKAISTIQTGKVESLAVEDRTGLVTGSYADTNSSVSTKRLLPSEHFKFSEMISSSVANAEISLSVRSDQILGEKAPTNNTEPASKTILFEAIASAVSAGLAFTALLAAVMTKRTRTLLQTGIFGRNKLLLNAHQRHKDDVITYIAGMSGVMSRSEYVGVEAKSISYLRLADTFLFEGLNGDNEKRQRCILGLRAILLTKNVAESSIERVRQNLDLLGVKLSDEEFDGVRTSARMADDINLRREIAMLFWPVHDDHKAIV